MAEEIYYEERKHERKEPVKEDTVAVCIIKKDENVVTCDIYKGGKFYTTERVSRDKLEEILKKYNIS